MPCRDYYDENPSLYYQNTVQELKNQISFAESALCQTLQAFERTVPGSIDIMSLIDFKAAGITREDLATWWIEHKRRDAVAAKAAQAKAEKAKLREAALSKLTAEEKKALGIKK
jgi:hypothetical protein